MLSGIVSFWILMIIFGMIMIGQQLWKIGKSILPTEILRKQHAFIAAKLLWLAMAIFFCFEAVNLYENRLFSIREFLTLSIISLVLVALQVQANKQRLDLYNSGRLQ